MDAGCRLHTPVQRGEGMGFFSSGDVKRVMSSVQAMGKFRD